jgi:hypothetical protein
MSEYQRIAFRAIDGPVSDKNLAYMRQQSSRAEITAWAFDNEYHFGDFGGNAVEMLRRGYDLHLHYANFGTRKLLIRLPQGLPDFKAAQPYLGKDAVEFLRDKVGPGGILAIQPSYESGELEELWELDDIVDRLVPLRAEILDGDLRPLYLAHLAIACDSYHSSEETKEAPVPAGLEKLSDAQRALAELYGLSDALIAAAAQASPPLAAPTDPGSLYTAWLQSQPQATKDSWLSQWMSDPNAIVRREILVEFQKSRAGPLWPTSRRDRTIGELEATAEEIQQQADHKAATNAARERAKRLAGMRADPAAALREIEELVTQRSTEAYSQIATLLSDLREALAGSDQSGLAEEHARLLKTKYPKFSRLTAALRGRGFVPK